MVTGWRRAFCTSVPRSQDTETQNLPSPSPSPKSCGKFGFFSNPSTPRLQSPAVASPRLRCRTGATSAVTDGSPRLICKTTETSKSPRVCQPQNSNPSSPKSPSRFALFKSPRSRLSKRSCGICLQSVKTGQGAAIFTSECSHSFHFTCITAHVANKSCLVCPVCNAAWRELPLLAIHKEGNHENEAEKKMPSMGFKYNPSKFGSDIRLYDDDEPLVSLRFNPIPEAEEGNEEEEEIGEFHGFFANPAPSAKGGELVSPVEGALLPEAAVVSVGRSHESYAVVLRVKTPGLSDRTPRASVDLVAVLDVSESVSGAKLHTLRRAMKLIVASLGSTDRLSIVAFSAGAKRLLPLRRMTPHGQRAASRIVDRLGPGNGRSVAEALGKAGKVLEDRRERNPVASIFLLSDGKDEQGNSISINRSRPISLASTSRFIHLGTHVHAFGFGHGSESSSYEAFAKSLSELLSVVVQDLRVNIGFPSGEIFAVYSAIGRPALLGSCSSSGSIKAGDLNAEEERDLLLELRVPSAAAGSHHVLSVGFSYKNPATREIVHNKEQPLLIPRPHAVRSSDPKIQRLRNVFVSARAVAEARRMVERNDLDGAHRLLASARGLILQSTSRSADADVRTLETELAELHSRRQKNSHLHLQNQQLDIQRRRSERSRTSVGTEPLTPTSAWRYAEQLAKVAIMRKSMNRVSDLHGFENARF